VVKNPKTALAAELSKFVNDPATYVYYNYPWKEKGTILAEHNGPDKWQVDVMDHIMHCCRNNEPVRIAVASGHGIGKSALVAWLIHWFMTTRGPNPQIVVTANTRNQLMTKTWRELSRWNNLAGNSDWFNWTATKFYGVEAPSTWAANAIPWSKENSEAFAGTHEEHVLVIFDEASAVDDVIWEVTEGAMTTAGAMWICFGNPTRNTGRFKECFEGGKFAHRWYTLQVDSRTAKMADQRQLEEWIDDYGIDSDFARVRVLGQFPRAANAQFIPSDIVDRAMQTKLEPGDYEDEPKVLTCDPARFGDDKTVIMQRQGNKVIGFERYKGLDTMAVARLVADKAEIWGPDAIFVDGIGIGAGVVDRLRQMNYEVFDVQVSNKPDDEEAYYNHRAEIWGRMRKWLNGQVELPRDDELRGDLIGIEYGFDGKGRIQLEKKADMKKRGLDSPDIGDALALGFSVVVRDKTLHVPREILMNKRRGLRWQVV
jgi:hypothetical protein